MSDYQFPHDANLLRYAADVADALAAVKPAGDLDYYVSEVTVSFEGEPAGITVVPDEHGGYGVVTQ